MPSRMSPFTIAIDPPSCTSGTVWRRNDVWTPSNVKFMWPNGLPRTANSLWKSSPVVTPGSTWMARIGSFVSRLRRFWISALPSVCCPGTAFSCSRKRSPETVTFSLYVPVPSDSAIVSSSVLPAAISTGRFTRMNPTTDT